MGKIEEQRKIIAARLLEEQGRMGLTNYEMAIRIGISESQYSNIIRCRYSETRGYYMDTLNKIFDNTNIKSVEIFG